MRGFLSPADETHAALSPSGNYIIEQPDGNYMFYS